MAFPVPRGVLFDFGDTLLREGPVDLRAGAAAVLERASETGGLTAETLATALAELLADLDPRRQASQLELPPHTTWSLIYGPRGIRFRDPPPEIEWVFWQAATSWSPEPGVAELLAFLAQAGIPRGIVSNTMFRGSTILRQLERSGLGGSVPWVLTSAEHVVRKPHPRLFALAAGRLGLPPADVWFVGDSFECDVQGAVAAGMTPVWYCRSAPAGAKQEPTVLTVPSFAALHAHVAAALGAR